MKIVVICGPTGVGKTAFSIALADRFDGEIVGADSMQVYRYMDIGTAKPDTAEREAVPHHVVDFLAPDQAFDAGKYMTAADRAIDDIRKRGRLPIVAGGTGLYIRVLLYGLFSGGSPDEAVMARLEKTLSEKGAGHLYETLARYDPEAASHIHPNDTFRVIRALEVFKRTGNPKSGMIKSHAFKNERYPHVKIGLYMEREALYRRIDDRVDRMMAQGFVEEVRTLLDMGYPENLKSMNAIGYRHVCDFLNGRTDEEEMVRLLKRDTRRFAKRQHTWFRRERDVIWMTPGELDRARAIVADFLQKPF